MTTTSRLDVLPARVVELDVCKFLDAASLARLSCTCRELHAEIGRSPHWATHVTRSFGLAANKLVDAAAPQHARLRSPQSAPFGRQPLPPRISWRDVFFAAWVDSLALAAALRDNDIVQVYHRHPHVLLSQSESKIRDELVLMHGLRRFPHSASLLQLYAQAIRQDLVVRIVQ